MANIHGNSEFTTFHQKLVVSFWSWGSECCVALETHQREEKNAQPSRRKCRQQWLRVGGGESWSLCLTEQWGEHRGFPNLQNDVFQCFGLLDLKELGDASSSVSGTIQRAVSPIGLFWILHLFWLGPCSKPATLKECVAKSEVLYMGRSFHLKDKKLLKKLPKVQA